MKSVPPGKRMAAPHKNDKFLRTTHRVGRIPSTSYLVHLAFSQKCVRCYRIVTVDRRRHQQFAQTTKTQTNRLTSLDSQYTSLLLWQYVGTVPTADWIHVGPDQTLPAVLSSRARYCRHHWTVSTTGGWCTCATIGAMA